MRTRCARRTRWNTFGEHLFSKLGAASTERAFARLRGACNALEAHAQAGDLVSFLRDKEANLDAKELVYAALVDEVRERGEHAALAMRLLWIGLWPGLCAIRRRWSGWFVPRTELDSELANCFTEAIERVDPARGHRLAATLVGNTERLLRQASEREREDARILRSDPSFLAAPETAPSRLGILEGVTEVEKVRRLRAWLTEVAGLDADLVLRAALFDHARRDLGDEIGIDSVVVRKRLERALRRAREQLDEKSDRALSQRGSEKRVPRLTPNSRLVRAHKKESS